MALDGLETKADLRRFIEGELQTPNVIPMQGVQGLSEVVGKGTDYGLVTALPAPPAPGLAVGDRCAYKADAGNGVFWNLIYDGQGSYPWKSIGSSPLIAESGNTQRSLTNQTAYTNLPTDPISLTVPLAGDYDITVNAGAMWNDTGLQGCYLSYAVGATAASDTWAAVQSVAAAAIGSYGFTHRHLGVAASAPIAEKGRTTATNVGNYISRRLSVTPVRVG